MSWFSEAKNLWALIELDHDHLHGDTERHISGRQTCIKRNDAAAHELSALLSALDRAEKYADDCHTESDEIRKIMSEKLRLCETAFKERDLANKEKKRLLDKIDHMTVLMQYVDHAHACGAYDGDPCDCELDYVRSLGSKHATPVEELEK